MSDTTLSPTRLNAPVHSSETNKTEIYTPASNIPSRPDVVKQTKDDEKTRDAANKFEALLIHNMLKSMRKTTMADDKSNARGIYDDMLDEKIADVMIDSGGLGVADQIVAQIMQQKGRDITTENTENDRERLRSIFSQVERSRNLNEPAHASGTPKVEMEPLAKTTNLKMASSLWGSVEQSVLTADQKAFLEPLIPHAVRNARKLGTTPAAILAIAALETGWGRSTIKQANGDESHNYFGIKASASDVRYATILTTEYLGGTPQKIEANFKTFNNAAEAVDGFAHFIRSNPRYTETLTKAGNPAVFLQELQNAGYATDPQYASKAISIMRQISGAKLPL